MTKKLGRSVSDRLTTKGQAVSDPAPGVDAILAYALKRFLIARARRPGASKSSEAGAGTGETANVPVFAGVKVLQLL